MRHVTWLRWLALGALVAPIAGSGQGPQPKVRELATLPVDGDEAALLPNGRIILYVGPISSREDGVFAYDVTTKRSTLILHDCDGGLSMSRAGDRIAYNHPSEDGKSSLIWTMPINPETGAPTGPAQRVTMGRANNATLSPDGKLIAFRVPRANGGGDVGVVPATGGTERILSTYDKPMGDLAWSADGKWIYVRVGGGRTDPSATIQRVPAGGGRSEVVFSFAMAMANSRGLIDGQVVFFRADAQAQSDSRVAYQSASGAHGEFSLPSGSMAYNDFLAPKSLVTQTTQTSSARIINLATGAARDLLPGSATSREPVWSPDGRRLAFQDSTDGVWRIVVMNPDGSQLRRYPVTADGYMQWSRNGLQLAYRATAGQSSVAVLDLATGAARTVSSSPDGSRMNFMWRPDGKSMVISKQVGSDPQPHFALYEASLDGSEHMLRDTGADFPNPGAPGGLRPGGLISDKLMIVASESEQAVTPTNGGPVRKLPAGTSLRFPRPCVSPPPAVGASWILWLNLNGDRPITSVDLMTTNGDSLRTLQLPFEVDRPGFCDISFRPDAQHVILAGRAPGESVSKIFLVPLDGSTPRVLTQFSGRLTSQFDVSPDGKNLVYTLQGAPSTRIYEVDVTPILQSITKP